MLCCFGKLGDGQGETGLYICLNLCFLYVIVGCVEKGCALLTVRLPGSLCAEAFAYTTDTLPIDTRRPSPSEDAE